MKSTFNKKKHQDKNSVTAANNSLTQTLLETNQQNSEDNSNAATKENSVTNIASSTPKASFANSWIKPGAASYIVVTGFNIAIPHLFGQTIGKIPVVSEWTAEALKTVFTKVPTPLLDMLMTAGNMGTYKSVKSFFCSGR